jgi:hypothetical protein
VADQRGSVVRRDGSSQRELPPLSEGNTRDVIWLGDGASSSASAQCRIGFQDRDPDGARSFLIDPDSDTVVELSWIDRVAFRPDAAST